MYPSEMRQAIENAINQSPWWISRTEHRRRSSYYYLKHDEKKPVVVRVSDHRAHGRGDKLINITSPNMLENAIRFLTKGVDQV